MIHKMFSVFDVKAKAYLPPFIMPQFGMALRVFSDCVNDETHQFGKHPEDYMLYHIAEFDDAIGVLTKDEPVLVSTGVAVIKGAEVE